MPTFTSSREASKDEMAREIDRCHKVIADLEARAEAAEERARVANGAVVNFEIAHAQPGRRIADLEARLARVLEDEAEHFIQAAIDRAPEPLRRLGEWLSKVLDEDQWATAERMLLGAATQPARVPSREEVARAIHDAQWPGIRLRKEHREKYLAYADAVLALFAKQETKP